MSRIAVVFWSGTGNTEAMAGAVADGAAAKGAEVETIQAADFIASDAASFDAIAFGCPAMGAEELEEGEFQPMWEDVEPELDGKRIALFGSYDWGTGEWMEHLARGRRRGGRRGRRDRDRQQRARRRCPGVLPGARRLARLAPGRGRVAGIPGAACPGFV